MFDSVYLGHGDSNLRENHVEYVVLSIVSAIYTGTCVIHRGISLECKQIEILQQPSI